MRGKIPSPLSKCCGEKFRKVDSEYFCSNCNLEKGVFQ